MTDNTQHRKLRTYFKSKREHGTVMPKRIAAPPSSPETVISIIGPGMRIVGDCHTTDTVRIEGRVEGSVRAEKAVVIGKGGSVTGDIHTQDAVIAGSVKGALDVESRLELQSTCLVDGEIRATRLQLEEGGVVNGTVSVGRREPLAGMEPAARAAGKSSAGPKQPGGGVFRGGAKSKATK